MDVIFCAPCLILGPLHGLAMCGYADIVDWLTVSNHNRPLMILDPDCETHLLQSLPCKWIPCCVCDPSAMNPFGLTQPHQWAANNGQLHTIMVLAKNGADIEQGGCIPNAMEIAERDGHTHVSKWIQGGKARHGASYPGLYLYPNKRSVATPASASLHRLETSGFANWECPAIWEPS